MFPPMSRPLVVNTVDPFGPVTTIEIRSRTGWFAEPVSSTETVTA
jgi:hypothetical protein